MGGRPPKPTAKLKHEGGYRADRHASRADASFHGSRPNMPANLGERGKLLWSTYFECAPDDMLIQIDAAALEDACRTWDRICAYQDYLASEPLEFKVQRALIQDQRIFIAYSAKLGLTPVDRAKLHVPSKPKDDDNPLAKLRAMRAS